MDCKILNCRSNNLSYNINHSNWGRGDGLTFLSPRQNCPWCFHRAKDIESQFCCLAASTTFRTLSDLSYPSQGIQFEKESQRGITRKYRLSVPEICNTGSAGNQLVVLSNFPTRSKTDSIQGYCGGSRWAPGLRVLFFHSCTLEMGWAHTNWLSKKESLIKSNLDWIGLELWLEER